MSEMKPCWHCGGKAVPFGGAGNHAVKCEVCGVTNEHLIADETTYLGYEGYATEAEAIEAWNTRHVPPCETCEQMDNRDSFIFHLLQAERHERTCRMEERYGDWYCTKCGELVGTVDTDSELCIDGNAIEMWNFCPNCGARVIRDVPKG